MDITNIEQAIASIASHYGYDSIISSEQELESAISTYPVAWIELPKVLYVEGRDQGVICHKVSVTLLDDYKAYSFEDKSVRLAQMQEDMIDIMREMSLAEGVVEVNGMSVTAKLYTTTRHGDIGQVCEASIISYF